MRNICILSVIFIVLACNGKIAPAEEKTEEALADSLLDVVFHAPAEKDFPNEGKHIVFYGSVGKGVDSSGFPIVIHHGVDSVTEQYWEYEKRTGWVKLSDEEYDLKHGRFFVPPIIESNLE